MDYHDIFVSCRTGDLEKVKYLVEAREVELNIRDKWDTTPLYYACLCGHEALVKYLLENGASCEAKTFDGERCLYAALSDSIRKLLRSYKMITSTTMRRDMYDEFLRRLCSDRSYCDAVFRVYGEKAHVHRCILAVRCPTLHEKLHKRLEERKVITLKDLQVDPASFRMLLSYIYEGRTQLPYDNLQTIMLLARQCGLPLLTEQLEKKLKEKMSFEHSKIGVHIDVLSIDNVVDKEKLKSDLCKLADQAIPAELSSPLWELPFPPNRKSIYPDLCFMVEDYKFMCHKAFFCLRSDYFKALLRDHFDENSGQLHVESITLHDINVQVFKCVLYYVYTDSCELTADLVFDVMVKADMYLLPGLKRFCAAFIAELMDEDNIFTILRLTRLFDLPKLEDTCAEFIANNIEAMVKRDEFAEVILEDAENVSAREDSDTIDIIDSVRYHLTSHVQTYSEIDDSNTKLTLIDNLLDSLNLDC